jgi:2,5-furandicarboxylate decarboxylase 1
MAKDLRTHLKSLQAALPAQWANVSKTVDSNIDLCAIVQNLENEGRYPTIAFQSVIAPDGQASKFPVIANLFSTREAIGLALDLPPEKCGNGLSSEAANRANHPIAPQVVSRSEAPVKEVVLKETADLTKLPIPVHHVNDGGAYIVAGSVIIRDPEFNTYNAAMLRMQLRGPRKAGITPGEAHHSGLILSKYEKMNKPTPVAIVLGHHPAYYLGSQWETAGSQGGLDEYALIGGMLGEPLRLVPSETFGDELLVPADAEIVLEGIIPPGVREPEGPMCEHTRYYKGVLEGGEVKKELRPVFELTAITHRRDAYFLDTYPGHADQNLIGAIPKEGVLLNAIRHAAPGVQAVHLPLSGCGRYICYFSLRQRTAGEVYNAIMAAFGADWHLKYVVAVDDDINVFNEPEVLWAVSLRTQPIKDTLMVPKAQGAGLDPSTPMGPTGRVSSKMGIDATKPFGVPYSTIGTIPAERLAAMSLRDYLD